MSLRDAIRPWKCHGSWEVLIRTISGAEINDSNTIRRAIYGCTSIGTARSGFYDAKRLARFCRVSWRGSYRSAVRDLNPVI